MHTVTQILLMPSRKICLGNARMNVTFPEGGAGTPVLGAPISQLVKLRLCDVTHSSAHPLPPVLWHPAMEQYPHGSVGGRKAQ